MTSLPGFGKSGGRKFAIAKKLKDLGVGASVNKYHNAAIVKRIGGDPDLCRFDLISTSYGLNDITAYNNVYSNESFSDAQQRFVVVRQNLKCEIKSACDTPVLMDVYIVKLKKDWNSGYGDFETDVLDNGFSYVGLTASASQHPAVSIYQNTRFLNTFNIVKSWKKILQPAEHYMFNMRSKSVFRRDFWWKNEATVNQLKGTYFILLKSRGTLSHDSTTMTNIGTADYALDCLITKEMVYRLPDAKEDVKGYATWTGTRPTTHEVFGDIDIEEQAPDIS